MGMAFFLSLIIFSKDLDVGKLKRVSRKEWVVLFLRSLFIYVLGVTLYSRAVIEAKISNVSFVGALPFVAILGFLFLREQITAKKILYVIIGFIGVILVAVKSYANLLSWGQGEILALVSSFFLACSFIARRWHSKLLNDQEISVLMFAIGTALLVGVSLFTHEHLAPPSTWSFFLIQVIFFAGLINVAHAYLSNYGFANVDAVPANNILILTAVFATILALFIYGEVPTMKELIGGVLIILSAYQMNRLKYK